MCSIKGVAAVGPENCPVEQTRANAFDSGCYHCSDGTGLQVGSDDGSPEGFPDAPTGTVSIARVPVNVMDSEKEPSPESPAPGYQPTTGRKLFMLVLCLVALIAVWVFYWLAPK
jgi:hypothetical protein